MKGLCCQIGAQATSQTAWSCPGQEAQACYMVCHLPCRLHQNNGSSKQAALCALHRQGGSGNSIHSWHWPGHCKAPGARGGQGACLQQLATAMAALLCPAFLTILPRVSSCRLNTTRMPAGLLPNFIMQQACSRPCMCSSWWAGRLLAYLQ